MGCKSEYPSTVHASAPNRMTNGAPVRALPTTAGPSVSHSFSGMDEEGGDVSLWLVGKEKGSLSPETFSGNAAPAPCGK